MNINQLTNLSKFVCNHCGDNTISTLDLSYNINLTSIVCIEAPLQTIILGNKPNLTKIDLSNSSLIENISFNNCPALEYANLATVSTASYDFTNNHNLNTLLLSPGLTTGTLDLSQNPNLSYLSINDVAYSSIILKNGTQTNFVDFNDFVNPGSIYGINLEYICADDNEIANVRNATNNNPNIEVNSYCSITPGGNYNTITGVVKYDSDNNGCDSNDVVFPNIKMKITQWGINSATFTNQLGNYTFYTTFADQLVEPQIENPSYFNFSPQDASISFPDNNNNVFTQNFCLSPNGTHNDLEVAIMPVTPARPGFDAFYKIVYKNKGNQTLSGSVNLAFDDLKTDFVIANPVVDNLTTNSLTWNYSNLLPFESRSITIVLNVNSPIEIPTVNNGDVLDFTTSITPIIGDEFPSDNTFDYNQTVVGSFDPNDITCLEGETVSPSEIGNYLHYAVNFENTGTYEAENVVVKDVIDTNKFDIESLQVMNTSNPAYI